MMQPQAAGVLMSGRRFVRLLIVSVIWNTTAYGLVLFPAAGTWHWWQAWVLLVCVVATTIIMMVGVFRTRPELLRERMRGIVQKGQPTLDRLIILSFLVAYGWSMVVVPLDVFHWHLMPKPPMWVSIVGLAMFVGGWTLVGLSFRDNAFAVPVVRHQKERQHTVVDWGIYRVVRHPLYAGVIMLNVGMALWLGSYAGAIAAIVPAALLIARLLYEERFLRRELAGYAAYLQRVRYRLVPYLW
ncbi:MAG TPA: isoprenylcysteine carboxylmethyltransferase family protein [Lacipirellulaceae bacterium]|nr:isoprenylcysteine carboxylmethyltransferase family protein [Lacipirellulaceae bacterium]